MGWESITVGYTYPMNHRIAPVHSLPRRSARLFLALAAAFLATLLMLQPAPPATAAGSKPSVLVAPIEGAIDPVTRDFVRAVLDRANRESFDAVVFEMDTPGGLMSSMDDIKKDFLSEKQIPVMVWVGPSGARAASAGAFITMASDVAAMAPGTNIGSATPIQGSGKNIGGDLRKKVINDAVASMRALAKEHGRDPKFAEDAIVKAANIDAREAKQRGVVEFVAESIPDLLDQADGFVTKPKQLRLDTADAAITRMELPWSKRLLKLIIDPNIIFLLFTAGIIGLGFELTHPGVFFPGVAGAICMVIALFGLQVLPTTTAGVVLLLLAAAFFAAEIAVVSHGVLGAGGAICLFLGGLLLFKRGSGLSIDLWLLLSVTLCLGGFFIFVVRKVLAARRAPVRSGAEGIVGSIGVVRRSLNPSGRVYVQGELWEATSAHGEEIPENTRVEITRMDGMRLAVQPVSEHARGSDSVLPG